MADLSKIKLNGTNYDLNDSKARVIYIDIEPGEEGYVTSDGLTYSELKTLTENKDNVICLRHGEHRWYLVNSGMVTTPLVGSAVVGEAIILN